MTFARRGQPDTSRTWQQVKTVEADALSGAASEYRQWWREYSDPQDLGRAEQLDRESTQATVAAHVGPPRVTGEKLKKAEDLLDRLRAHRLRRLKGGDHEL